MKTLLLIALLCVAQSSVGAERLSMEVPPLSLGQAVPSALALEERSEEFRGWSFDNEIEPETARTMWQRFFPWGAREFPRVRFSLRQKQVAEVQFLIHSNRVRELGSVIERELTKRYGNPAKSSLKAVQDLCPSELVRKWSDEFGTLILVIGEEYGAVYVSLRQNKLAKNITSKKQTFYSEVRQGAPCLRW